MVTPNHARLSPKTQQETIIGTSSPGTSVKPSDVGKNSNILVCRLFYRSRLGKKKTILESNIDILQEVRVLEEATQ